MTKPTPDPSLENAIARSGSMTAFAKAIRKPLSTVSSWISRGQKLPAELVLPTEEATGISRHDLRPDLYPREEPPAQPPAGCSSPPAGGSRGAALAEARP